MVIGLNLKVSVFYIVCGILYFVLNDLNVVLFDLLMVVNLDKRLFVVWVNCGLVLEMLGNIKDVCWNYLCVMIFDNLNKIV